MYEVCGWFARYVYFWRRRFCRCGVISVVLRLFCLCDLLLFCPSSLALLAGVGPLVPGNGALVAEAHQNQRHKINADVSRSIAWGT